MSKIFSEEELKYKAPRDCQAAKHSAYYLCENFTSRYNITGRHDKSMMDIISETREGLLFAVYSYEPYSKVSIKARVSSTPCRGNLNFKHFGKNSIFCEINFVLFFSLQIPKTRSYSCVGYWLLGRFKG